MSIKKASLFAFIILTLYSGSALSSQKNITVALGEWPPYASESLPHKGLLPLLLKKAFADSNINLSFTFMSWQSAYEKTRLGEYDISPGWFKTPKRVKDMKFSEAMNYINLRFFHSSDKKFSWDKLEEIYPLKLGIVSGYSYGKQLDEAIQKKLITTIRYENDKAALNGVANKEIDLYPADTLVAQYILNELPPQIQDKIALDEHTINSSPIFLIGQSSSTQEIIDTFNQGLNKLKEHGEYAKILENFDLINKLAKLNFFTEDNAPINYQGENGPSGIMVSAINTVLMNLGADTDKLNIQILPWARAYKILEKNNNTALFAVTKTDQRASKFKWAGPIYRSNIILLGLKSRFPSESTLQNIEQNRVCAVKYDVGEQLWREMTSKPENIHMVSHPSQCAKMLSLGRVDLWASGEDTSRWHLQKNKLDTNLFKKVYQLKESFRYIAFSKDVDDGIIDNIQKSLNYLQLSGKLNELITKELNKAEIFAKNSSE